MVTFVKRLSWCTCAQERIRPEYAALASALEVNPVMGLEQPHFPDAVRHCRFVLTGTTVLLLVRYVPTNRPLHSPPAQQAPTLCQHARSITRAR